MFKSKYLWIDKDRNRFRVINTIFGLRFGEWQELPLLQFVSITKVKFSKTVSSPKLHGNASCTSNFSDYKYCVFLCEDTRIKKLVFKGKHEEAINLAKEIADYLNLKMVDFTN